MSGSRAKRRRTAPPASPKVTAASLRRNAEDRLVRLHREMGEPGNEPDAHRLLHELQVHQIELEMQNAELLEARSQTEALLEKYTDLYDLSPVGYCSVAADGRIKLLNLTAATLFGHPRGTLLDQRLGVYLQTAQRSVFHAFLSRVWAQPDRQICELIFAPPGTAPRTVQLEAQRQGAPVECRLVVTDVTERNLAREKLQQSETRYRLLFETAQDGVLLLDHRSKKITDANPYMTKLLGCTLDQLVGKTLCDVGLLNDRATSLAVLSELQRKHEVRVDDLAYTPPSGPPMDLEVLASLYQEDDHPVIQCNVRDITGRKATEMIQKRLVAMVATAQAAKRELASRRKVEISLRESESRQRSLLLESRQLQVQLRELTRQIITAQEAERRNISRELHDEVMQTLVSINTALGLLGKRPTVDSSTLRSHILQTSRLLKNAIETVHRFARNLRPAVLDDFGLVPALEIYTTELAARKKFSVRLTAPEELPMLGNAKQTVLFRVAQEALANVAKHARCSRVDVRITEIPGAVRIEVQDNGKSFDVGRTLSPGKNQRLGLLGMRERVEMVGGTLVIESNLREGTVVRAEIPEDPTRPPPRRQPHERFE